MLGPVPCAGLVGELALSGSPTTKEGYQMAVMNRLYEMVYVGWVGKCGEDECNVERQGLTKADAEKAIQDHQQTVHLRWANQEMWDNVAHKQRVIDER